MEQIRRLAICTLVLLPVAGAAVKVVLEIQSASRFTTIVLASLGGAIWAAALLFWCLTKSFIRSNRALDIKGEDDDRIGLIVGKVDFPRSAMEQVQRETKPAGRLHRFDGSP